jgi:hypothetical protein
MNKEQKLINDIYEELARLRRKLVDRDTNFGMNESYRLALDDVRQYLSTLRV